MSSPVQALSLYKSLLRTASKFDNYNFREYFKRKVVSTFKENKGLAAPEDISTALKEAQSNLEVLKRQATISQMYKFDKTVVEPLKNH